MRRHRLAVLLLLATTFAAAQTAAPNGAGARIEYTLELKDAARHLLHVRMRLPAGAAQRDIALPVWNALYQVRDFSQYLMNLRAHIEARALPLVATGKSSWRISGAETGAEVEYDFTADLPGPFGIQFNDHHAFLNLAMLLMYVPELRGEPVSVELAQLPKGWQFTSAMQCAYETMGVERRSCQAPTYDRMVDSPIEIGTFHSATFVEGSARYYIAIDADPADYNEAAITNMLRRIVAAETQWMNDRPFDHYLFIYHFPKPGGGGGMEHAYSTAIDSGAERVRRDPLAIADVSAHEFFHLWNVKRIRPQSLEPVDYTREQYTRALWFSEGVTSTVADYIRLRAGFIDERRYLESLARVIGDLQSRPAHLTQSAEESSLTAWLEKYPAYHLPERSISYYVKGEVLGVLLDLQMLEASHGRAGLRELFQYLNEHYAKQGRFFNDSDGVREAAEALTGASFADFFARYVAGTAELPYNELLRTAGLQLEHKTGIAADPGFTATRAFDQPVVVASLAADSAAENAGLQTGDVIEQIDGKSPAADFRAQMASLKPGAELKLRVLRRGTPKELHFKLGQRERDEYFISDLPSVTPEQYKRRARWLGAAAAGAAAQ